MRPRYWPGITQARFPAGAAASLLMDANTQSAVSMVCILGTKQNLILFVYMTLFIYRDFNIVELNMCSSGSVCLLAADVKPKMSDLSLALFLNSFYHFHAFVYS
jgi:hypothetical protein